MTSQRTILVTFAGRRDRMKLLTRYVDAAIEANLIDEWHVWDFTRTPEDARWLRARFPVAQTTPSHSLEYFRAPEGFSFVDRPARQRLRVRATSDVHIGLRRTSGEGPSYEIILGGWGNAISAIRVFEDASQLTDSASRDAQAAPAQTIATPQLLSEFDFSDIDIEVGADGLKLLFNGAPLLAHASPVSPGEFDLLYHTGYGANGDWRLPGMERARARLFVSGPEAYFPRNAMFYTRAYQHYAANLDLYRDDVILKCDDDIVHFDLRRLADFIAFRKAQPEFFLVSANVINNGVCAHFQQQAGVIPADLMECELPPGGMCGSLWSDGQKAEALHKLFLSEPARFQNSRAESIAWNERISINFIALLGRDLVHVPDIMADDEHDLCYGVRKRARKSNCIFTGFLAAHLSFWKQDVDMDVPALLKTYEEFAKGEIGGFEEGLLFRKRPVWATAA